MLFSDDSNDARIFGGGFIDRSERRSDAEAQLRKLIDTPRIARSA